MKKIYVITEILHAGRKGIRYEPVTDIKYDGLIGCKATFDITEIERFESTRIYLLGYNPQKYRWWDTSEVLGLIASNGKVELETANTIYRFEEWHEIKKERK